MKNQLVKFAAAVQVCLVTLMFVTAAARLVLAWYLHPLLVPANQVAAQHHPAEGLPSFVAVVEGVEGVVAAAAEAALVEVLVVAKKTKTT